MTFSSAVKSGRSWWNWKTKPIVRLRNAASCAPESPASDWPPISTVPASGRSSAPSRCSSVDFPEPEGPTIATSSPGSTARSIPCSTSTRRTPSW